MKKPSVPDEIVFLLLTVLSCVIVSVAEGYMEVDAGNTDYDNQSNSRSDITCWTCPNKSDNEACNNWAPDVQCPLNHTICKTVHRLDTRTGQSVSVHKMCAPDDQCTWDMVGCYDTEIEHVMECISCCNYDYCNEPAPFNHTSAIDLSASIASMASSALMSRNSYTLMLPWILTALWTCTNLDVLVDLFVPVLSGITLRTAVVFKKDYFVH